MEWYMIASVLVVGLVCGFFIGHKTNSGTRKSRRLDEELKQTRQEMADYRTEVQAHFTKSAELVNELTANYCAVYEHLANGAQTLVGSKMLPVDVTSPAEMLTAQKSETVGKAAGAGEWSEAITSENIRREHVSEKRVH